MDVCIIVDTNPKCLSSWPLLKLLEVNYLQLEVFKSFVCLIHSFRIESHLWNSFNGSIWTGLKGVWHYFNNSSHIFFHKKNKTKKKNKALQFSFIMNILILWWCKFHHSCLLCHCWFHIECLCNRRLQYNWHHQQKLNDWPGSLLFFFYLTICACRCSP